MRVGESRSLVWVPPGCERCRVPAEFVADGKRPPAILACTVKVGHAVGHRAGGVGCPLAKYGAGHVCDGCYARPSGRRGRAGKALPIYRYGRGSAARAYAIRLDWALASMMTDAGLEAWAGRVAHAISHAVRTDEPYVRAFDSGDFLNHRHIRAWTRVADLVSPIRIWNPTRTWRGFLDEETGTVRPNLWLAAFKEFVARPNVSCRPSALQYDEVPPDLTEYGFSGGHMVVTDWSVAAAAGAHRCPSTEQGGRCDGRPLGKARCTFCSQKNGRVVAFLAHGGV